MPMYPMLSSLLYLPKKACITYLHPSVEFWCLYFECLVEEFGDCEVRNYSSLDCMYEVRSGNIESTTPGPSQTGMAQTGTNGPLYISPM